VPHRKQIGPFWVNAIVGQAAVWHDAGVASGPIGEIPSMGFFSIVANESDSAGASKVRIEHVAGRDFVIVNPSEAKAATSKRVLFHLCKRDRDIED
jgi:hypothetical protein